MTTACTAPPPSLRRDEDAARGAAEALGNGVVGVQAFGVDHTNVEGVNARGALQGQIQAACGVLAEHQVLTIGEGEGLFVGAFNGGLHGGVGEVRYKAGTEGSKPIPYRLYQDAARRVPLVVDVPVSGRVPDTGTVELPLYARIERLAEVPKVSRYSDLVKVTVTW